jgi:hypothetical protein
VIHIRTGYIQTKSNEDKPVDIDNLLIKLNNLLDKTKFFGTIELSYQNGELILVRSTQSFKPDSLLEFLK